MSTYNTFEGYSGGPTMPVRLYRVEAAGGVGSMAPIGLTDYNQAVTFGDLTYQPWLAEPPVKRRLASGRSSLG